MNVISGVFYTVKINKKLPEIAMANYCDNKLTLYHADAEKITEAIKAYNEGRLLEHFIDAIKRSDRIAFMRQLRC